MWSDCERCQQTVDEDTRRKYHCAYLPEREWLPYGGPPTLGGEDLNERCPGGLVNHPLVTEAAKLRSAMKHNALREFYPRRLRVVMHGAMELDRAFARHDVERWELEKQKREAERNGR